jgi:hypothetical protein
MLAEYLESHLRAAGLPVLGVTVGRPDDRSTWIAQLRADATPTQRSDAAALLASVTVDQTAISDAEAMARLDENKVFRALVIWLAGRFGITPLQARNQILTIYRGL